MEENEYNMKDDFPQITTPRLKLREIKRDDSKEIFKLLSDPKVIEHDTFELFTDIKQAEKLIEWFDQQFEDEKATFWGITLKSDNEIIGFCKCEIEVAKVRADLGYNLRSYYWNKGIMTESIKAIMDYTFKILEVNRIEAAVSTRNLASIKLLEKLNFTKEGVLRQRSHWKGSYHDMIMYSILRKELDT